MKSTPWTCPAALASSPVKRPIPAPSSSIDLPSYDGSKDRTYRTEAAPYQNVNPVIEGTCALIYDFFKKCDYKMQNCCMLEATNDIIYILWHTILLFKIKYGGVHHKITD
jgi:hypothetical protein